MRTSQFLLATTRENPADAEIISHQLMLRAGMIRMLAAGIYAWLPIGLKVLRKVEEIIREEMNRTGAQELLMPAVQPAELWQESGRWEQYGPELLRIKDRHARDFCLGPTHEEIITDLARREIRSYKQLPINFYQIQTKFRDEIRPRFGIMRAREFLMKDAYSFHLDQRSLEETYATMYQTYVTIFKRLGLEFRAVLADSGNIGGTTSHEFHVLARSGEDAIAFSDSGAYSANVEHAQALAPDNNRTEPTQDMMTVETAGVHSIEQLCTFLKIEATECVKTLIVQGKNGLVALAVRGDHELNVVKAEKLDEVASPLRFASEKEIIDSIGCKPGSIGPVGLSIPLILDHTVATMADFVCGANQAGKHVTGVNLERDIINYETADIRNVITGDPSPDGSGPLNITQGIEVGHIFQLGKKYSAKLKATCLDAAGNSHALTMGCYGIGVSRIVAAAIEQNHDHRGIIWPSTMAPFQLCLIPINQHKSDRLRQAVDELYYKLLDLGYDILLDDRKERPGVMFADMELIGIPHRLTLSERGLDAGKIEYTNRKESDSKDIRLENLLDFLEKILK